ncbi:MAG: hypothetical protein ACREI3_01210 [Nitrospirales bacterium]
MIDVLRRPPACAAGTFRLRCAIALIACLLCLPLILLVPRAVSGGMEAGHEGVRYDHGAATPDQWEGSAEGVAYSEFNHHLAGVLVLLIGLSELHHGLALRALAWSRFLLPAAMLAAGAFLLIWSDHAAWPIGSMSLAETLSGEHDEVLQHKIFGVLLLGVSTVELLRRLGRASQDWWKWPLPGLAIVGGLMLFLHTHGPHPSAHQIMIHHTVMGALSLTAGACKLMANRTGCIHPALVYAGVASGGWAPAEEGPDEPAVRSRWEIAWAALILVIGLQLVMYSE